MKYLLLILIFFFTTPVSASVITKTIGTSSRDYSTVTLWEADLDSALIYLPGDQAVGEMYDDSAFDESVTIDGGGTIGLIEITVQAASGERHNGTAGTGARMVGSAARTWTAAVAIPTTIAWIEFNFGDLDGQIIGTYNTNTTTTYLRNNVIHDAIGAAGSDSLISGNNIRIVVENNIVYNAAGASGSGIHRAILAGNSTRDVTIVNNTVHNTTKNGGTGQAYGIAILNDAQHTAQNNAVTDTGGAASGTKQDYLLTSCTLATCSHNSSSDTSASGTGSLTSVPSSDLYVSTTGGSEDLHLKAGADAIDAGTDLVTTPTNVNIDIDGRDRDAQGDVWDIGADELVAAAPAPSGRSDDIIWFFED